MIFKPIYKLIDFVSNNFDKLVFCTLSRNPNAIHLLEKNMNKIEWNWLCLNPNAIHIIEQNLDHISWQLLSENPNAIEILENNKDKINWIWLARNPNIFKLDCEKMKKNCQSFAEELAAYVFNPVRLDRFAEKYNLSFEEIMNAY